MRVTLTVVCLPHRIHNCCSLHVLPFKKVLLFRFILKVPSVKIEVKISQK